MVHSQTRDPKKLTRRGSVTRSRIIQAAQKLLSEHGVAGTSLDEIMAIAGVSKSQLYHYFEDKEAIVAAAIQLQVEQVLSAQNPALRLIDSRRALQKWRDVVVALSKAQGTKGGCPIGSLANELSNKSEQSRKLVEYSFEKWRVEIENGLQRMKARGELSSKAKPDELATAILSAAQGGLLLAKTSRSVRPVEIALDMALAYVDTFANVRS
jgi:TetR/AcrR family transcriptional repressor of nem operon|nr:TetR/AcrR family transcriptional regulator [Nitrosomonas nitrosa]